MKTFRFRFPVWHVVLTAVVLGLVAWTSYRTAMKPTLHWLDALITVLMVGAPLIGLWREARFLGGSLTVSASGLEFAHPRHPSLNWRVAAEEIERVGTFESAFERRVVVVRKSGVPRVIAPAYWEPSCAAAKAAHGSPLVSALAEHFPLGKMGREETGRVMAPSMELGRVAARLTVAAAVMALATIGVLFSIPLDMLGGGIPWIAILVVFAGATTAAAWLMFRDPTAQVRVPLVAFLFGMTAAFLFTISAQKAVYMIGAPEDLRFVLVEVKGAFQIWRDVEGRYSSLEFPAAQGRYRETGTVVPIEVRTGPFGLRAMSHAEIKARLSAE